MTLKKIDYRMPGDIRAFSTMRGTVSPADPYSGFNACHYTGDRPGHIARCRKDLCDELGIDTPSLIIPRQTHTANVAVIDRIPFPDHMLEETDAIVTRMDGVALCVNTADCVPLLMADAEAGVIAAAHSGWRGTAARIAARTVESMRALGADPARIYAAMGPSICPGCFETGHEVADLFRDAFPGTVYYSRAKPHIDLPAAIKATLMSAGLDPAHISPPPACTFRQPDIFFSARRLGISSGRTLSVIMQPTAT